MKNRILVFAFSYLFVAMSISGCAQEVIIPIDTVTPTASLTPTVTVTVTPTPSPTPTLTPSPTPTERVYESGYTIQSEKDGMTLIYVPAGEFLMGDPEIQTFSPQITVYLDAYWIDQTEVTVGMYQKCVESGACTLPLYLDYYNEYYADYPVMKVDKNQAQDYCAWVGRNLPTEAQWEKAARGTDGRKYPWGDIITHDYAKYGNSEPTRVGRYHSGVSPYGAFDMAGNVWEWVSDKYDANYYEVSPLVNPQGPSNGTEDVVRGGGWENVEGNLPTYFRGHISPSDTYAVYHSNGFRCAMDAN